MKNKRTLGMLLTTIVALGFAACSPSPDRTAGNAAVPDMEEARAQFQQSAEERMQTLLDEMKGLKDRVGDTDEVPDVKVRIEQWERKYEELEQKLESKEAATIEEWRRFEGEVDSALTELRASYDDLASDLRAAIR
jgi:predicted  nucleic acid-binding Zn-ribbon protein